MLGGSTSKLARLGSNLGNFISNLCLSNAEGISLVFAYILLFSCTADWCHSRVIQNEQNLYPKFLLLS